MTSIDKSIVECIGWALCHFLWQGLFLSIGCWFVFNTLRQRAVHTQYLVLCGGLVLMAACPVATVIYLWPARPLPPNGLQSTFIHEPIVAVDGETRDATRPIDTELTTDLPAIEVLNPMPPSAPPFGQPTEVTTAWKRWQRAAKPLLPGLVFSWTIGVCILSIRLLANWRVVRRLSDRAGPAAPTIWQERLWQLSTQMRIRRKVRLVESILVDVPTVIGWLKPVILLPVTAITGLETAQLESLIAHELAHIRRYDYLVNIGQAVIETLLFYHPAVWWISGLVRQTREVCCDELAVAACGNRLVYARALAAMEELRTTPPMLSLAANGTSLLGRIRRILTRPDSPRPTTRPSWLHSGGAVLVLASLSIVAVSFCTAPWYTATGDMQPDRDWKSFLARLQAEESKYQDFSSSVTEGGNTPELSRSFRLTVQGDRFHFVGEDTLAGSAGKPIQTRRRVVFDGRQTVAIEEGSSAMLHAGRAEPPQMVPPHCWGIFHLAVNFPLSVYLGGTEALRAEPKVGRYPEEAGSAHEFYKIEAQIVGQESIDGLNCLVIRVKRWYYTNSPPAHQYLWLALDRNYHVAQSRWAIVDDNQERPRQESRVKAWRQLADNIWLPEVVEVFDISAKSVQEQRTQSVIRRLTLTDARQHPHLADDVFRLPEIPAELPTFEFDGAGNLVNSPMHPVPLDPSPTTTLEQILDRLSQEERKFDSCESIVDQEYNLLNLPETLNGLTLHIRTRLRYVIQAGNKYFDEESFSTSPRHPTTSSRQQKADDRKVLRATYLHSSDNHVQLSAFVDFTRSEKKWRGLNEMWLLRLPRDLAGYLRSGWEDVEHMSRMNVEYVGDERVGPWACHKLKCNGSYGFVYLWLARDRNLLPVCHEWHQSKWHATLPTTLQYVVDLQEVAPEVWFPKQVVEFGFQTMGPDGLVVGRLYPNIRRIANVSQFSLHPAVDDRLFAEINAPKGTKVWVIDPQSRRMGPITYSADGPLEVSPTKLRELIAEAEKKQRPDPGEAVDEIAVNQRPPSRKRTDTSVGTLLNRLEQLNHSPQAVYKDGWLRTLQKIVELGPDAVPELIEELDATQDDRMLRCLGFILRAINDPQAVPALIRAIPKTLRKPDSDMGLKAFDAGLMAFARQHDLNAEDNREFFDFGRPVREIGGALQTITGRSFGEESLYGLFRSGNPPEWRESRRKYHAVAKTWSDWWEADGHMALGHKEDAKVNLPALRLASAPRDESMVETIGEKHGLILESVFERGAQHVFYDIDADRLAELPDKWRDSQETREHLGEHLGDILAWAHGEGFDLMGTELNAPPAGSRQFVLQGIGLETWELAADRWKSHWDAVTLDFIREQGRRTVGPLVGRDAQQPEQLDLTGKATFLVITSEGMPALLNVGVEVQDDGERPGHFFLGDPELNPNGPKKGRRFAISYFDESGKQR